jgi:WD repeat-containing protein 26
VWLPDGSSFITASLDSHSPINTWNSNGDLEYKWPAQHRSQDIAISPDGERLVSISTDCQVFVYRVRTRQEEYSMMLRTNLTCINISRDSRYILVNLSDNELQLIDIDTAEIVQRFLGQKQGVFMIKSTFGGADENLVISGSEGKPALRFFPSISHH